MLLDKFWVVRSPTEESEMEDVCWETDADGLMKYILGSDKLRVLRGENVTLHSSETTAKADAEGRMRIRAVTRKLVKEHRAAMEALSKKEVEAL